MIFTSKYGKQMENNELKKVTPMRMNLYTSSNRSAVMTRKPSAQISRIAPSDGDRMRWGAPTWALFHTIPEKLSNKNFVENKTSIIQLIMTICNNLPCPSCSQHATQYMRTVNFNAIHTVEDLKKMLYIFHNSVNERKKYAEFPYDGLSDKYANLDFNQVVNKFMFHFQQKVYAMNLIAQQISRQKQVVTVKKWFLDNMHLFQ
jgi:hypothetical protein